MSQNLILAFEKHLEEKWGIAHPLVINVIPMERFYEDRPNKNPTTLDHIKSVFGWGKTGEPKE